MRSIFAATAVVVMLGGMVSCSAQPKPSAEATPKNTVRETSKPSSAPSSALACAGGTFSKFQVRNVKARSYEPDSFSGRSCTLTPKAEGVIWVATGEGYALQSAEKKLVFTDDQGRQFGHTCWSSSGTINGVTQTEIILFGPHDSKKISVCCGVICAEAQIQ